MRKKSRKKVYLRRDETITNDTMTTFQKKKKKVNFKKKEVLKMKLTDLQKNEVKVLKLNYLFTQKVEMKLMNKLGLVSLLYPKQFETLMKFCNVDFRSERKNELTVDYTQWFNDSLKLAEQFKKELPDSEELLYSITDSMNVRLTTMFYYLTGTKKATVNYVFMARGFFIPYESEANKKAKFAIIEKEIVTPISIKEKKSSKQTEPILLSKIVKKKPTKKVNNSLVSMKESK